MFQERETLEIVIPIFNEEECLDELLERLLAFRERVSDTLDLSFIFVNDGSVDRSRKMLRLYATGYKFIKVLNFSRNFGHQLAVTAGLDHCSADYVVIIDADLQDPPELIKEMVIKAKEGYDVVYGQRLSRSGETKFKLATARWFYRIFNWICGVEIPIDTGDFRLITKKVVSELQGMREQHRFLRAMVPWLGFKSTPLPYNRNERVAGITKYSLYKMLRFALHGILSFSKKPLRLITYLGLITVVAGLFVGLLIIYLRFFTQYSVPGISATILMVIIMGGIQILMTGIISEYMALMFEQLKSRPLYVLDEVFNIVPKKDEN